jgi:hypothetical protein
VIEDVTFENCTNDGQGLTPQLVSIFSYVRDTVVTVGGAMNFIGDEDTAARTQEAIVAIGTSNTAHSITVLSNTSKPAHWYFTNYYRPIELAARTAPVHFEAYSLVVENATLREEGVEPVPFHALSLAGGYLVNISVTTITVQDLGVMNTLLSSAGATLKVGDLSSINCRTEAAFLLESPANITSTTSITIQDPFQSGVKTLAEVTFDVVTFEIFRTNPNVTTGSALVARQPTSVYNSNTFYIHHFKTNGDGAALWTNSQLNISGRSFVAEGNVAEGSGAGAYVDSGQLNIHTTWQILFSANEAAQGGALALGPGTGIELSCAAPGGVSFDSNKASMQGGALFIHPTHQSSFASLSFQGNSAPSGCVVAFTTGCQKFDTAINSGSNILTVPQGTSSCVVNEYMCGTYAAPPPSPVATANPVQDSSSTCAGSPPAVDTWTCQDGHWTSDGPITVPGSLTVPADSQLVVVGDLTVPENLVFTGLHGTVTVQGGCTIINGVVQIDITSKDLEEISKDPASMRAMTLLSQNSTCTSLASVGVSANKIEKTCRKVKSASSKDQNDGGKTSLVVVLQVDSSSCNTKRIVLGCVLGGVLIIVIIAILLVTFNSKAKTLVRPFWARKKATALH